jgi:hypothetical protein
MKPPGCLLVAVLGILVVALVATGVVGEEEPAAPEYRKVPLSDLVDAAGRARADLQVKVTWCGPQTKPISTIVLGTLGRRLNAEKYVPLRRERWHYGNDDPYSILYYQLAAEEWAGFLRSMKDAGWGKRMNPEKPDFEERFHVIFCRTGWLEREYEWAELYLDSDCPELRELLVGALSKQHPARSHLAERLFRGY